MVPRAVAALAVAIGVAGLAALVPVSALAQPPSTSAETRRVAFGEIEFVLHAPARHCLLDTRQAVDEQLAAFHFRPRAGKTNTYLGAFVDCKELAAIREKRASFALSFGYYLAATSRASNPVTQPRDQYLRALCEFIRANHGSLDFVTPAAAAKREIEAQMQALPIGPPRLGKVVAQDANGCTQLFLYKRKVLAFEHREVWLTTTTLVKGRPLTYTRIMPYFNPVLPLLVKSFQSEVAVLARSNS